MKTAKFHAEGSPICRILRGFIHHREFILLEFSKVAHVGNSKFWTVFASGSVERKNWKDFHLSLLVEYEDGLVDLDTALSIQVDLLGSKCEKDPIELVLLL